MPGLTSQNFGCSTLTDSSLDVLRSRRDRLQIRADAASVGVAGAAASLRVPCSRCGGGRRREHVRHEYARRIAEMRDEAICGSDTPGRSAA